MKSFKFTIQGNKYDVNILNLEDGIAEVEVNGTVYKVELEKKITTSKTPKLVRSLAIPSTEVVASQMKTSSPTTPKGTGFIKSPLPGVIIDILVKEGDKVSIGQKLIILEAMKMENNINADKQGIVKSIKVSRGDNVLEGDILIEIE
jgi:biotin carboxyl carrier protein